MNDPRRFVDPVYLGRSWFEREVASQEPERICSALIALALYENDIEYAMQQVLVRLASRQRSIRASAVTSLAHPLRIHGRAAATRLGGRETELIRALSGFDETDRGLFGDVIEDAAVFCPELTPLLRGCAEAASARRARADDEEQSGQSRAAGSCPDFERERR